jgi:hypothetical protein
MITCGIFDIFNRMCSVFSSSSSNNQDGQLYSTFYVRTFYPQRTESTTSCPQQTTSSNSSQPSSSNSSQPSSSNSSQLFESSQSSLQQLSSTLDVINSYLTRLSSLLPSDMSNFTRLLDSDIVQVYMQYKLRPSDGLRERLDSISPPLNDDELRILDIIYDETMALFPSFTNNVQTSNPSSSSQTSNPSSSSSQTSNPSSSSQTSNPSSLSSQEVENSLSHTRSSLDESPVLISVERA